MPLALMFVYCSSAIGGNAPRFGYLLLETAMTEFTAMSFECFGQAAEYIVVNMFVPARF